MWNSVEKCRPWYGIQNQHIFEEEATVHEGTLSGCNIELVTCNYGTGHKTTALAVAEYIKKAGGQSHIYNMTEDEIALQYIDPLYRIGKLFQLDLKVVHFFNWVLRHQLSWLFNAIEKVEGVVRRIIGRKIPFSVVPASPCKDTALKQHLREKFIQKRPDLLVTTYHMDLNPLREVCAELKIPLLHIPTDFSVKANEVFEAPPAEKYFYSLLPNSDQTTEETAFPIPQEKLISFGIPLREPLYKKYTSEEIAQMKQERGIDPNARVVLVMSGGGGQDVPFPDLLLNTEANGQKYHMIVVAGGNNQAGDRVARLNDAEKRNPDVTVEVAVDPAVATEDKKYFIGAEELSRLYAIADCGFSKPGGISLFEHLHTGLPVLIDCRNRPFSWEKYNADRLVECQRGVLYSHPNNFLHQIDTAISLGKQPRNNSYKHFVKIIDELIRIAQID